MLSTSTVLKSISVAKSLLHTCWYSPNISTCANPQLGFGLKNRWCSCTNSQSNSGQKSMVQAKLSDNILGRRQAMLGLILPLHLVMFETPNLVKAEQLDRVGFGFDGLGKDADDYAVAKVVGLAEAGEGALIFLGIDGFEKPLSMAVGAAEAIAVLTAAQERTSSRPVTHEAWGSSLAAVGWKVDRIAITSVQSDLFFSRVILSPTEPIPGSTVASLSDTRSIDVRPSDAIALALRCRAPLFVSKQVADVAVMKSVPKVRTKPPQLEARWLISPVSLMQ